MGNVIRLATREPEEEEEVDILGGTARCTACGHEWRHRAARGHYNHDCPACGLARGTWVGGCAARDGEEWWKCDCGNAFYYITRKGVYCTACGAAHTPWD